MLNAIVYKTFYLLTGRAILVASFCFKMRQIDYIFMKFLYGLKNHECKNCRFQGLYHYYQQ